MSPAPEPLTTFERNARTVLEESVRRIDARTRSRLNQARHAALEAAQHAPHGRWRSFTLMPAAGAAAAAVLVAVTLWHRNPGGELPLLEASARRWRTWTCSPTARGWIWWRMATARSTNGLRPRPTMARARADARHKRRLPVLLVARCWRGRPAPTTRTSRRPGSGSRLPRVSGQRRRACRHQPGLSRAGGRSPRPPPAAPAGAAVKPPPAPPAPPPPASAAGVQNNE